MRIDHTYNNDEATEFPAFERALALADFITAFLDDRGSPYKRRNGKWIVLGEDGRAYRILTKKHVYLDGLEV